MSSSINERTKALRKDGHRIVNGYVRRYGGPMVHRSRLGRPQGPPYPPRGRRWVAVAYKHPPRPGSTPGGAQRPLVGFYTISICIYIIKIWVYYYQHLVIAFRFRFKSECVACGGGGSANPRCLLLLLLCPGPRRARLTFVVLLTPHAHPHIPVRHLL